MKINEELQKPIGHLKIEVIDKTSGLIKDTYEHKNMIMDGARKTIKESMTGFGSKHINKFVLGTQGHKTGDLLTPKTAEDGFVVTRTELFSEESSDFVYNIGFEPTTDGGFATVTEDDVSGGSTVKISMIDNKTVYLIEVGADAANNGSQVPYTEACLYTGDTIFSMRCFAVRVKDNNSIFRITWSIQY